MRVTFFTIRGESSPVAQRNLRFCRNSFNASVAKGDWVANYMRYGLCFPSQMFAIMITDTHVLRYCVPMDNQRPQLDLKFYRDICPSDENGVSFRIFVTVFNQHFEVPVILVFTKYDQFLRNVEMHLLDYPHEFPNANVSEAAEKLFQEHYLNPLGNDVKFVRLESEFGFKYQGYMLMFSRNAQANGVLQWSHWEDCCIIEWRYCSTDALSCAKGKFGIEC